MWLGLTLTMSHGCVAPEPAPQEALGGPQEASGSRSDPNALCFRGCLRRDEEGCRGEGSQSAEGRPQEAGPCGVGGSGSQAHLVCVRFIRLIANKGIRANLLI